MTPLSIHYYETRHGTVVAVQVTRANLLEVASWTGEPYHRHTREHDAEIWIAGLAARYEDWIVRHPDGRFERLHDDEFHHRYQRSAS